MKFLTLFLTCFIFCACASTNNYKSETANHERSPASISIGNEVIAAACRKGQFTIDAVARLNADISSGNVLALVMTLTDYNTINISGFKPTGDIALHMEEEIDFSANGGGRKKSPYYLACAFGKGKVTSITPGNKISP